MTSRLAAVALMAAFCVPAMAQAPKEPFTRTTPAPNETPKAEPPKEPVVPDYASATFVPAVSFTEADRPRDLEINTVLIHDIEGSAEACLAWFQNPKAKASSHYVTDADGHVWQMVKEKDIAWHAGNWAVNQHSIGIENEGFAYRPGFFAPSEYEGLAALVRDITTRYHIPRDREHIIGHFEVPNPNKQGAFGGAGGHTDPGPYWDWDSFLTLVRNDARVVSSSIPAVIRPGELLPATVKVTNAGDDTWTANNSGAQDDNVARNGAVYLGVSPVGTTSAFFNYKYWTSPRLASSLTNGDTVPGTEGTFSFRLLGPRQYGRYTEKFRVTHYPVAPKTPTAFGETVTAVTEVVPWDIPVNIKAGRLGDKVWQRSGDVFWRKTAEDGAAFTWETTLPIAGAWDVYARWTPNKGRSRKAFYRVFDAKNSPAVAVSQRKGGGWVKLGRFTFDDVSKVSVALSAKGAPGTVVADAVRFVGPF